MRKLGVMSIWGREDFVLPALEQALDLVDEVAVTVCCMHPALEKFRDRSRDLALGFARGEPRVHYLEMLPNYSLKWEVHMSEVLNALLDALRPESGDIVWLLDCDEFYNEAAQAEIAERIESDDSFSSLRLKSYMVGPDFYHYLISWHTRIHRHRNGRKFIPTSFYAPIDPNPPVILENCPMFHYSLACSSEMKQTFWLVERGLPTPPEQQAKADWVDKVYKGYDTSDQSRSLEQAQIETGRHRFWFGDNIQEVEGGGLFKLTERHPRYLYKYGLIGFSDPDFRFKYPEFRAPQGLQLLSNQPGVVGAVCPSERLISGALHDLDIKTLIITGLHDMQRDYWWTRDSRIRYQELQTLSDLDFICWSRDAEAV